MYFKVAYMAVCWKWKVHIYGICIGVFVNKGHFLGFSIGILSSDLFIFCFYIDDHYGETSVTAQVQFQ